MLFDLYFLHNFLNLLAALSKSTTASTSMFSSSSARQLSSTTSVYLTSQTGYLTNLASSTSQTTATFSTPYIYWLEWTGWECKNVTVCLMSRTRNCSTYKTDDCEKLGRDHFHVEPCRLDICPGIRVCIFEL
jgi:hypothetical protein